MKNVTAIFIKEDGRIRRHTDEKGKIDHIGRGERAKEIELYVKINFKNQSDIKEFQYMLENLKYCLDVNN